MHAISFVSLGRGALFIIDHSFNDRIEPFKLVRSYQWPGDGLLDVTWSELSAHIVWLGTGDGHLLVYDLSDSRQEPIIVFKGHQKDVYSLDWNQVRTDSPKVLTCSWDKSIKVWDALQGNCLMDLTDAHDGIVYSSIWSPRMSETFASVGGDGKLKIWSMAEMRVGGRPNLVVNASQTETLSCDWSKYSEWLVAVGSVDGLIHGWDIRMPEVPVVSLRGHERAVKKVKFNPFDGNVIGSVSYDLTTRLWNVHDNRLALTFQNHSEFVYGLDFNCSSNNCIADCGWDQSLVVFNPIDSAGDQV